MSTARCSRACWRHDAERDQLLVAPQERSSLRRAADDDRRTVPRRRDAAECAPACWPSTGRACAWTARCSTRKAAARPATPGVLRLADGRELAVADTRKGALPGEIVHVLAAGRRCRGAAAGQPRSRPASTARAARAHMRFHTATHLLCALVPHPVDGCSITAALCAARFPHERAAGQAAAERRHRAPGGRGAPGAPPLDQRGRARRQPAAGAQHERACRRAARAASACSRSKAWTCSPAAARMWRTPPTSAPWSSPRWRRRAR